MSRKPLCPFCGRTARQPSDGGGPGDEHHAIDSYYCCEAAHDECEGLAERQAEADETQAFWAKVYHAHKDAKRRGEA